MGCAGSRDMKQIGLDAFKEALRAGSTTVKIDVHPKTIFEEKLEVHEAGQAGREFEFDEKIKIMHIGLATRCRSKKPEIFNSVGTDLSC